MTTWILVSMLNPDDNDDTIWIQRALPPQGKVPDVVKSATYIWATKLRYLPLAGAAESPS
jgi:hypothetical protein